MSAIAAIFQLDGSPVERAPLERIMEFLRPQGPDGISYHVAGPVGLGNGLFRATSESQSEVAPCSLDGKVWITADAFLTGREELVDALRAVGREAALNRPDSELILHAYHAWGDACLDRLLGYFAFILWDGAKQRVLAARDHFGNRALYYAHVGQRLVLANSLDGLMQDLGVPARLSDFHVGCFLALGATTYLDQGGTSYEAVRKVRHAECLVAEQGEVKLRRYWVCPSEVEPFHYRREEEVVERFRELFARVIRDRLRSRKLCFTVSGGMDSTSVLAMTAHVIRQRGHGPELVALSQDHRRINPTREAELAGRLCRQYGIPQVLMNMDEVPWLTPDYSPVTLMVYPIGKQQEEFVRRSSRLAPVVMTGTSGDMQRTGYLREALLGQGIFSALRGYRTVARRYRLIPDTHFGLYRWRDKLLGRKGHFARHFPEWIRTDLAKTHGLPNAFAKYDKPLTDSVGLSNRSHPEIRYWCGRKDNATVFHGNAADTPGDWLDPLGERRLVDFYLSLPLLPWFAHKFLLREAMAGLLPDEIRLRPRDQVVSHHASFFHEPGNEWIDQWRADPRLERYVNRRAIPPVFGKHGLVHQGFVHMRALLLNQWLCSRRAD